MAVMIARRELSAAELRMAARRTRHSDQARRLLAIALVLEGTSRTQAARITGMDRQTLRDRVIRSTSRGRTSLVNIPSLGAPKLNETHKAFLAQIVHEGSRRSMVWCAGGRAT